MRARRGAWLNGGMDADVINVGAGLAGLTAARETCRAGLQTLIIDQEGPQDLGGQAWWSFGGLFLVDTPEQRRFGVRDSFELARQDWQGSAGWDRFAGDPDDNASDSADPGGEDLWAARWGRAYVEFAAGEKRAWIREAGIELTPVVGWAERGDLTAGGHGNSVPRFHVPWGTGTGVLTPFVRTLREAEEAASPASSTGTAAMRSSWRTAAPSACAARRSRTTDRRGAPPRTATRSARSSSARGR